MEINNFTLSNHYKSEKFKYGMKLIPNKSLNRLTDNLIVYIEKNVVGKDKYNICFKKKIDYNLACNSYRLSRKKFEEYILFLTEFNGKYCNDKNNIEDEFIIEDENKIIITSLNKKYIKISSIGSNNDSLTKIFFTLLKEELSIYIAALKKILREVKVDNSLSYQMEYLINPINKKERDKLYLEALYAFANSILDNGNREAFNLISKEINRILET